MSVGKEQISSVCLIPHRQWQ